MIALMMQTLDGRFKVMTIEVCMRHRRCKVRMIVSKDAPESEGRNGKRSPISGMARVVVAAGALDEVPGFLVLSNVFKPGSLFGPAAS